MIQKIHRNDRRILKFPAVRPCEGVSPLTLLTSLIDLSQNICGCPPKLFATQRRNAREAIRQIRILLMFFEEIRDCGSILPDSVVLSFSELHLALQKVHYLLEDCSREGGRIWILMKSQFVTNQFRLLIRSVATALEVLPLNSIDVGDEVRELVELVTKQARNAKIEPDPEDGYTAELVLSILDRFGNGFEPELNNLKRVLEHLDIRSWSGCNKEIKFLEEELNLERLESSEREAPFLSSLVNFMCYCRAVAFQRLDGVNLDQEDVPRSGIELLAWLNPDDFRCPISLELMTDPVTVSTGQTYDRASIEKWLKSGNTICPKTGEKLATVELVPNHSFKRLVQQLCADSGISLSKSANRGKDISRTTVSGSVAAEKCMKLLAGHLARSLVAGTDDEKNKAAYEVRLLAKSNIYNRSCLVKSGTISPLLKLLSSSYPSTQLNSMSALLNLSKHSKGKRQIMKNRGLDSVLSVLNNGLKLEAKQTAAATIFYLSSVEEYRKSIGENPITIPGLLELLKIGTTSGKRNAIVALFALLLYPGNHTRALENGIVALLVGLIASSDRDDLVTDSLAILSNLAEHSKVGALAIFKASALPSIITILNSSNSRSGKEYCASILLSACVNNGLEAIGELARSPALPRSLYSLITDGTNHASRKARSLLRMLHKYNETNSSGAIDYAR